jgi:hypothetical protein
MDLKILTREYLRAYRRRLGSSWEINYGDCYRWALLAQRLNGGQLISVTVMCEDTFSEKPDQYIEDGTHAFVLIDGKYYDSESPEGVTDWHQLNYFHRHKKSIDNMYGFKYKYRVHPSVRSFKRYWKPNRNTSKADLRLYNKIVKEFS